MASKQFSMLATRKSPYIKSLLLPETGPASIPDDKIRRHVKRSESTTTNLTSTTGKGMLIVYNNHPKNLVGSHYTYASDGKLRFDRNLYTAQDLSKNFNYGRKVSQLVTIKSTQLPAGVYAMQGTMNGVCIDGAPSEVETALKYETILSASTNALDKVAGVLVNDGVGVLSLPTTFDNDYIRMGDPAPSSFTPGSAQLSKPTHNPGLNSIVTAGTTGLTSGTKTISTTKTIISTDVINVDSTEGLLLDLNIQLMRWGVPSGKTATVTVDVKTVDLAGAETDAEQREIKISGTNTGRDNVITLSGLMMGLSGKKPLVAPTAAVVIEVSAISSESMTLTHSGHINNYSLTSLCAGTPGTTNPITIIIYTDLTPGGIMTVTAVSNFELIPNAELRKNIPTDFGNSDPSEMDFIKRILGQRETLELRTIWDMGMYDARRDVLSEFAHLDDNSLAMAWEWSDVLWWIKKIAGTIAPIAGAVFPAAAPLTSAISTMANAASGRALAASGKPLYRNMALAGERPLSRQITRIARTAARMTATALRSAALTPCCLRNQDACNLTADILMELTGADSCPPGISSAARLVNENNGCRCSNPSPDIKDAISAIEAGEAMDSILTAEVAQAADRPMIRTKRKARKTRTANGVELSAVGVLLPVLMDSGRRISGGAFMAVKGDLSEHIKNPKNTRIAQTVAGGTIYGLSEMVNIDEAEKLPIKGAITVLPVVQATATSILVPDNQPQLAFNSWEAAACAADTLESQQTPFLMVTGAVESGNLSPNLLAVQKQLLVAKPAGIGLAANSDRALKVVTLEQLRQVVGDKPWRKPMVTFSSGKNVAQASTNPFTSNNPFNPFMNLGDEYEEAPINPFLNLLPEAPTPPVPAPRRRPTPSPRQIAVAERFEAAAEEAAAQSPDLSDALEVANWLMETGNIQMMLDFMKRDRRGDKLSRMLFVTTYPSMAPNPGNGPTPEQARWESAVRKAGNMAATYPDITPEWVVANGYAGPDQAQAKYFSIHRRLPTAGETPIFSLGEKRKPGPDHARRLLQRLLASRDWNEEQIDALTDYVEEHGTGPDEATMQYIAQLGHNRRERPSASSRNAMKEARDAARTTAKMSLNRYKNNSGML